MITFLLSILMLFIGYFVYGKIVDKAFGSDERETPAIKINDGVDYVPMPLWKVFLIQLLNIAGTGPIFGALGGAVFGPIVYLWIVFGCIFAGGVHDYFCGMISSRNNGASVSEITGEYLGKGMKNVMRVFSVFLVVMVAVVFTKGPADLLSLITPKNFSETFWMWIIIAYYFIATFVPIDKVIGKIYPLFGICLIIMAFGVSGGLLFSGKYNMPELWNNFSNQNANNIAVWPIMFITVACGAVSGFHATQSPMMARCIKSEKHGRKVFYGAMIAEGFIALVWAAAGVSCYENSRALIEAGAGCSNVVYHICNSTMGKLGSFLAILGVIACPISSGDTAYRSARLTIADWFNIDQSDWKKRLYITAPLLLTGTLICHIDYTIVWRYYSWSNQALAMIVLWACAVYMKKNHKNWLIPMIPAMFMTAVSSTYLFYAPECLGGLWKSLKIPENIYTIGSYSAGIIITIIFAILFLRKKTNITYK